MKNPSEIIGIDEAGRGPLAGPVAVAAVRASAQFDCSTFSGLTDSKQLRESTRERLYRELTESGLTFAVCLTTASTIDGIGINPAIRRALNRALRKVVKQGGEKGVKVLLDGGLRAPQRFETQETIVRGDETKPLISLASVAAKVERDRLMKRRSEKYPQFDFAAHKGYGTNGHRKALQRYGPTDLHRESFIQNIV